MVTQVTRKIDKVRRISASRTHQKTPVTAVTIVIYRILSCNHVRLNCNACNQARSLRALIKACRHYSPKKKAEDFDLCFDPDDVDSGLWHLANATNALSRQALL